MKTSELYHHGILGQKWGKRNGPPYPLDPAKDYSKEEQKHIRSKLKKIKDLEDQGKASLFKSENIDPELDMAKIRKHIYDSEFSDELKEKQKYYKDLENEYYDNRAKYAKLAADYMWDENPYGYKDSWEMTGLTKKDYEDFYIYDDGDQGTYNSALLFLVDKNLPLNKVYRDSEEINNTYKKATEKYTKKLVGDMSDKNISSVQKEEIKEAQKFLNRYFSWSNSDTEDKWSWLVYDANSDDAKNVAKYLGKKSYSFN